MAFSPRHNCADLANLNSFLREVDVEMFPLHEMLKTLLFGISQDTSHAFILPVGRAEKLAQSAMLYYLVKISIASASSTMGVITDSHNSLHPFANSMTKEGSSASTTAMPLPLVRS